MGISTSRAYLLCTTPRTGSTLLCGLLRSTGVAGRPESYFRAEDEQAWADRWHLTHRHGPAGYDEYVRAAIAEGSSDNGVFGARIMWGTLGEVVAKLGAVHPDLAGADCELLTRAFGALRFVYLWRHDTISQAVSWARAEQSGFWQSGDAVTGALRFDFELIDGLVKTVHEHNDAWRDWFDAHGITPHAVRYEDLVADMAGVVGDTLAFLGLDSPGGTIVPQHRRQADEINVEWSSRYRTLARSSPARHSWGGVS